MDWSQLFNEPRLQGVELGSPKWFKLQRKIIRERPLMRHHYDLWYEKFLADASAVQRGGKMVELGAGGSYLKTLSKEVITSDVIRGVADQVIDATKMPFSPESIKAYFLAAVFHHIPDVRAFLKCANRTLVPGGVICMVEPTNTPFARLFYRYFHPEPHNPKAENWSFSWGHNMHDSNQALSWIVFQRDVNRFHKEFPNLDIHIEYLPWFSYLCSGGVSRRNLTPRYLTWLPLFLDVLLKPFDRWLSLLWYVRIVKKIEK